VETKHHTMRKIVVTLKRNRRRSVPIIVTTTSIVARLECVVGTSNTTTKDGRGVGRAGVWVVTGPRGRATKRSRRHHGFGVRIMGRKRDVLVERKSAAFSLTCSDTMLRVCRTNATSTLVSNANRTANNQERNEEFGGRVRSRGRESKRLGGPEAVEMGGRGGGRCGGRGTRKGERDDAADDEASVFFYLGGL